MKSKKIDIDSLEDLQLIQKLANFLIVLDIKSAEDLYQEVDDIADENFCGECESHNDYCECNQDHGGRYMREYDDGADYED